MCVVIYKKFFWAFFSHFSEKKKRPYFFLEFIGFRCANGTDPLVVATLAIPGRGDTRQAGGSPRGPPVGHATVILSYILSEGGRPVQESYQTIYFDKLSYIIFAATIIIPNYYL